MSPVFLSFFFTHEDGYYAMTTAGYIICFVLVLLAVLAAAFLRNRKSETKKTFQIKPLVFSAVSLALAFVLSYIKIYRLPWGGSVTLLSMFFVTLAGYWYGLKTGLTVAFAYSLLQFIQGGGTYILSPFQIACDYFFAFTALGLSGLFKGRKYGLLTGYLVAIFSRGLFHAIGAYFYWMDYMPENFPKSLAPVYPIIYNYSYILIEGVLTVIIISLPPVKKALARVQAMATEA